MSQPKTVSSRLIRSTVCSVLLASATQALADDLAAHPFQIAPQAMSSALTEFARQSQQQILFAPDIAAEKKSSGVRGTMAPLAALKILLKDSGLSFTSTPSGAILVSPPGEAMSGASVTPSASGESTLLAQSDASSSAPLQREGQDEANRNTTGEGSKTRREDVISEIIVTAQKRSERLIDVPQSVSVLSSSDLNQLSATQFRDFASSVPGLSFTTAGAGNTQVTLRGVTVGGDISPTVGIYVDDVPYGSSTNFSLGAQLGLDVGLFDLDRVEVLRGPQGTLYGASAMGGLVKYVSKQPDTHSVGGEAQLGVSSTKFGGINFNTAAAINVPLLNDELALRVSGFESRDGGFIDNTATGRKDINRSDVYGGRFDLLFTPSDVLSIRLNAFIQNISRDGEGTADYTFAGAKPYGDLGQYRPFAEPFDEQYRLVSATVNYTMSWATMTSVSSYQTTGVDSFWDVTLVYGPLLGGVGFGPYSAVGATNHSTTDKFTQEVRLASSGGAEPLQWVIGGFYTHETSSLKEKFVLRDQAGQPSPNLFYTYLAPSLYKEYAFFGDLTWKFTEKFDVTGGVRYARNDQEETQIGSGFFTGSHPTLTSSDGVSTYLADARYHVSDHATAYARYATGYRPGGPNVVTVAGGPPTFASDRVKSYEAGLKAETDDGRFGVDVAAYYIDWDNIQISVLRNNFQTIANAPGGATIRGAELALNARPLDGLKMTGTLAYQDAKISKADANLGAAEGERLPNVPRFTAAVTTDYSFSTEGLQPTVGASVRYVGERYDSFDASTLPQYRLPSYKTLDLRSGLTIGSVNTQFYIHNLLDDRSQLSIIFPQFGSRVAIAQPRTIGVTLTTRF